MQYSTNRPLMPGEIIGYRKDGRPVRLQAGGSEATLEAPSPSPAPQAPPAAPPAQQAPPASAAPVQPPAQPQQPREPDGRYAPAQPAAPAPAQPQAPPPPQPAAPPHPAPARQQPGRPPASLREMPPRPGEDAPETERLAWDALYWKTSSRQWEGRVKAKNEELSKDEAFRRRVAEALNIDYDERPDPEEMARRLEAEKRRSRQSEVKLAILTAATGSSVNPVALLDSLEFMSRTAELDPESPDFQAHVGDLVREAASQPRYQFRQPPQPAAAPEPSLTPQVTQPPAQQQPAAQFQQPPAQPPAASSGADFSGAPGGNRLWTQADYDYWTAPGRDRDGSVMAKAIADGLLVGLGIGKPSRKSRR